MLFYKYTGLYKIISLPINYFRSWKTIIIMLINKILKNIWSEEGAYPVVYCHSKHFDLLCCFQRHGSLHFKIAFCRQISIFFYQLQLLKTSFRGSRRLGSTKTVKTKKCKTKRLDWFKTSQCPKTHRKITHRSM